MTLAAAGPAARTPPTDGEGGLRRLSIKSRLIILSAGFFVAMIGSSLYIGGMLARSWDTAAQGNAVAETIETSDRVRGAFDDLRYWQTDLAVSLLTLSEKNAGAARARLRAELAHLAASHPAEAARIGEDADRFDRFAQQAVEAYTDDQRVLGNTHFSEARQFGVAVDRQLAELAESLRRESQAARAAILDQFASAARVSALITAAAVLLGALMTIVILLSILRPLGGIVAAVRAITAGDAAAVLPPPSRDELGRVTEGLHLLQGSLAERARLTLEAERQRSTLFDAIESIAQGFALYGPDARLLVTNARFRGFHPGFSEMAAAQAPFREVVAFAARSVVASEAGPDAWIEARMETHGAKSSRVDRFRDGRWMQITERPTHDGGFTVLYSDVSELRRRQDDLESARDEAERATQVKSEFLANMSHELRTPLNAIIGYSQILQEDAADTGQTDFLPDLAKIETAGNHLLGLINDILDLSKVEAGRMEVFNESFSIEALARDVESLVQPLARKNGNRLVVTVDPSIGLIVSDATKVKQTIINLLSNAAKFTKNGTVELAVEPRLVDNRRMLALSVQDSGIGMSEEQIGRLFQAFSQADNSTTRKFGGTGLGLAISRSFARMLGGDITVTSTPGEGACFLFTLPLEAAPGDAPGDMDAEADAPSARPFHGTILVVDDDPSSAHIIGAHLARDGYKPLYAAGGAEALELARRDKPDLITLDIVMPQVDGWTVLSELKKDPELAEIPVVIVSIANDRALGFSLGAAAMMTKPVDRNELSDVIRRLSGRTANGCILVVEDDAATRTLMQRAIERLGHQAALAGNGRQGLDWLEHHPVPTAILLDLQMPEMDGFEFLVEIRADPRWTDVPVVVVTAKELTAAERSMLDLRAQQIIAKGQAAYLELSQALRRAREGAAARSALARDERPAAAERSEA